MNKSEVDFETTVLDYLSRHPPERRGRLIENLKRDHLGETGYSEASINRKLKSMEKAGLILIENDSDILKLYGIEKEAENASYVLAKTPNEVTKHLNSVFASLKTEDDADIKKAALREIKTYENNYMWSPSHLDDIALNLDSEDAELIDYLLRFLYNHMKKEVLPKDNDKFLEDLRNLLERYPEKHTKYIELRCRVIRLLGYYGDNAVIKQLKKDSKAGRLLDHVNEYRHWTTAKVIEKARTELYLFEIELRKEGNTESADCLADIRREAKNRAEMLNKQQYKGA